MPAPRPFLEIFVLRPFAVVEDGRTIAPVGRGKHKLLRMLKVLIALGGTRVPQGQLSESLWPDSDGDQAYNAFTTTLSRLRKLVGREALIVSDGTLSLNQQVCWVDCLALESRIDGAVRAAQDGHYDAAVQEMESALDLYRGPFLAGEFEPPELLPARERYHSLFLRGVQAVGTRLCQSGRHSRAAAIYLRALETDSLAEDLYRLLMRCYGDQERNSEGLAIYERCREAFRSQAGLDPSTATDVEYRKLKADAANHRDTPQTPGGLSEQHAARTPVAPPFLGPERRVVSVLCTCFQDCDDASARRDPEQVAEFASQVETDAIRIVQAHGGRIQRYAEGELLAIFGVPSAHEDDPVRAVRAALALREIAPNGRGSSCRSGIDCGLVVTGPGNGQGADFTLAGDPIRVATRLARRARPGEVRLTPEAQRGSKDFFKTEPANGRGGKSGGGQPGFFRVIGPTEFRSRFEASERAGYTPFTGRKLEIATLHACLGRALAGQGQLVTIAGEPGIGKSRLVYEFRRQLDRERVLVLEGRCQSFGMQTPYLPLLDALRRGLRLRASTRPDQLVKRAVTAIRAVDPALETFLPHLLHLLSIRSEEHPLPAGLQGEALKRAFADALAAITILNAQRRPVVEIFEDWHWADEASHFALRHLIGLSSDVPLLVIVLHRSQTDPDWGNVAQHTPIVLKSLTLAETEALTRAALRGERLPEGFAAVIHRYTGGNPLFVEEVCAGLREERAVELSEGEVRLTRPLEALRFPDNVRSVIQARVDRLDPAARETLRLASLIGREFNPRLLAAIHPAPASLFAQLDALVALDLVQQVRVVPEPEYRFKHVLTQATVYESLLLSRRKELHGRVGAAVEALFPDRIEEYHEALAHHYGQSDQNEKALEFLEKAGDKAAKMSSQIHARRFYHAALALAEARAGNPEGKRRFIDLALKLGSVSLHAANDECLTALDRAARYAREIGDRASEARSIYRGGHLRYLLGPLADGERRVTRLIQLSESGDDRALRGLAELLAARMVAHHGERAPVLAHLEKGIPLVIDSDPKEAHQAIGLLGFQLAFVGSVDEARFQVRRMLEFAKSTHDLAMEVRATVYDFVIDIVQGRYKTRSAQTQHCASLAESVGEPLLVGVSQCFGGFAMGMNGDLEAGIRSIGEGIQRTRAERSNLMFLKYHSMLSELLVLSGQAREASVCARSTIQLMESDYRFGEDSVWRSLALSAAGSKEPDWSDVSRCFDESIRLAKHNGERANLASTHFRYAESLHKMGDSCAAAHQLDQAESCFRDLDMDWWLEQAQALRGRLTRGDRFCWFVPYVDGPPRMA